MSSDRRLEGIGDSDTSYQQFHRDGKDSLLRSRGLQQSKGKVMVDRFSDISISEVSGQATDGGSNESASTGLGRQLETKSSWTGAHLERVSKYSPAVLEKSDLRSAASTTTGLSIRGRSSGGKSVSGVSQRTRMPSPTTRVPPVATGSVKARNERKAAGESERDSKISRVRSLSRIKMKSQPLVPAASIGSNAQVQRPAQSGVDAQHLCISQALDRGSDVEDRTLTSPGSEVRNITLGIEIEFELQAKSEKLVAETVGGFAAKFAKLFNGQRPSPRTPMRDTLRRYEEKDYRKWCLVEEMTVNMGEESPWGIELVTPILSPSPGSRWREDVDSMWKFIDRNYTVTQTSTCATHVHIGMNPPVSLPELKSICTAIIHFEPAIWPLLPAGRRDSKYARSNWLYSSQLAQRSKSRPDTIAYIRQQKHEDDVIRAMQPDTEREFCFNFSPLRICNKGTIEFRAGGASKNSADCLAWAEFVMTFIRAAISCPSSRDLQTHHPTVGGLRVFMTRPGAIVEGVSQPRRLQRLWGRLGDQTWTEPDIVHDWGWAMDGETLAVLQETLKEDRVRIGRLVGVAPLRSQMLGKRRCGCGLPNCICRGGDGCGRHPDTAEFSGFDTWR